MMDDQSMVHTSEEDSDGVASDKFVKRLMKKADQGRNSNKQSKDSKVPTFGNDYTSNSFPSRNVPTTM